MGQGDALHVDLGKPGIAKQLLAPTGFSLLILKQAFHNKMI